MGAESAAACSHQNDSRPVGRRGGGHRLGAQGAVDVADQGHGAVRLDRALQLANLVQLWDGGWVGGRVWEQG